MALLAVLVLSLAACSGPGDGTTASQIVARVNGQEISVHQINQRMQALPPGTAASAAQAQAREVLERLISQEVAVQQALAAKLDREPHVMQALTAARREVLARAWLDRVAAGVEAPDVAALRALYDAQPDRFAARQVFDLQELLVPVTPAQFEALRLRVQTARSAEEIGAHLRAQGLPLQAARSTVASDAVPPALLQRLLVMRDGQAVLMGAPGAARIVVRVRVQPAPLSFEQARPRLQQTLLTQRRNETLVARLDEATRAAEVERLGDFAAPAVVAGAGTGTGAAAAAAAGTTTAATPVAPGTTVAAPTTRESPASPEDIRKGLAGLQ